MALAPWPFGAVGPLGRLGLELGALVLLALWLIRALRRPPVLPPARVTVPLLALVGWAVLQAAPVGAALASRVAPRATAIRATSRPPTELERDEARILGRNPADLDPPATLSIDPEATASAARTGAALVAVLLVATTVAATRGARGLALALLCSAGFQGLYGLLVLVSGYDRIWNVPKKYFLDCATGTFVNRNHFACLLAMSLAPAVALICRNLAHIPSRPPEVGRIVHWTRPAAGRTLMLALPLGLGLAGLLLSYSRAGIALGLAAMAATVALAGRRTFSLRGRVVAAALVLGLALVPLARVGADRLWERYATPASEFRESRAQVWSDSLTLVRDFPVSGSGFGSFAAVFPLVRSPEIRRFYAHAHNDPLEALVEGGLVGAALLILVATSAVPLLWRCIGGAKGTLGIGFAAGLVSMLLHGLVDFNFHIPANAVTAAALAGVLIGLPWKDRASA